VKLTCFSSRESAATAAMESCTHAIKSALDEQGPITLVVSGGGTPEYFLTCLSSQSLPWTRVKVTLTDERCVPVTDALSNEAMVRRLLLKNEAAVTQMVSMRPGPLKLTQPAAFTLVGMGPDGHFASLFPDLSGLDALLDVTKPPEIVQIETTASPVPRLSMNLSALLETRELVLLAFGEDKKAVIQNPEGLPIAALLNQSIRPVHVYWAP